MAPDVLSLRYQYEADRDHRNYIQISHNERSYECAPHFHYCCEFMYVYQGTIRLTIDNESYELHEGQLAIIPSYSMHALTIDEGSFRWLVMIPREMLGSLSRQLDDQTFARLILDDDEERTLLSQIMFLRHAVLRCGVFRNIENDSAEHNMLISQQAAAFVSMLISIDGLSPISRASLLITDLLKYIHSHFREDIRIPELAKHLLCTQQHLSGRFRDSFGMTITAYINHIRAIDVYWSLQDNPAMTLEEAAALAGFGSVRSMLRAYKAEYGCTPTANR